MPQSTSESVDALAMTGEIVSAFVANNSLPLAELPALIQSVHAGLVKVAAGEAAPPAPEPATPAVSVRKSITPDYLVCLDDGKKFKSLRRHLTVLGMTPEQYRAKWSLPPDYPMVAANYAAQRSELAKRIGLGQIRAKAGARKSAASPSVGKRKAGRPRKPAAESTAS
ncbi:MAG: MucR family transcriptional regulator [Candidatus Acidiferrales bacterium]|jgi:predicted transcriptional regulator